MKKYIAAIITAALCIGILAGCGAKNPTGSGNTEADQIRADLAGTWVQITDDGSVSLEEMGIPSGYVFYVDGTGLDTFWNMTFSYTIDGDIMHISYDESIGEDTDYKFILEGDVLSMTRTTEDAITMLYQRELAQQETPAEEVPSEEASSEETPAEETTAETEPAADVAAEGNGP